jgi:two-component system NtrC family response regulator
MVTEGERRTVLVVEDDRGLQKQMRWSLNQYELIFAEDHESAIAALRRFEPAVMTLDLGLPPHPGSTGEGLRLLQDVLGLAPATKVIVITGQSDHADAVKAIGMGAYDFFEKPFDADTLALVLDRALHVADLERENRRLLEQRLGESVTGLITRDPSMLKVCRQIEKLAPTQATVLLQGESGTGKELLARALHQSPQRRGRRFVAINCAAIPEMLLESELFGYEKGAFTGANRQTPGKIECADGGTLFLDEVGDLPIRLQAKLLRFLQERVIERVGGRTEIPVDVRVVSATHQNLRERVAEGAFREDLYYRLSEIVVSIPPLRERVGDATLLAHAFLQRLIATTGRSRLGLRDDALAAIEAYPWPGNVRELESAIKRAVIMADGPAIIAEDLGLGPLAEPAPLNLRQARAEAERRAVLSAMSRADGNIAKMADLLGVSRPTIYELLSRLGLR